ncbi:hypothetical protein CSOJ01_14730 [Colletotrichum sojae]|uniref:Uncharacterized protein n=1 Tax=Colletotrichum sojae TaxID=2175907 RepID=A0A8H6MJK6_9PEZI|nr:hypothetical protein CSOJ01_14730 [Colletotrichum sojae]
MAYVANEAGNIQAALPVASTCDTFLQNPKLALHLVARGNNHIVYSLSAIFSL